MRVVSLNCSNTEIVCALGCAGSLVGVDSDSDYPADVVAALPRVGRDLDIEIDKVVALKPDLVLASLTVPGHEKVIANLERAGLPYLAPEPVSLQDVYSDIRQIATALNVSNTAERVVDEMNSVLKSVEPNERPSILVQWWPKPVIAPGRLSWTHDLIQLAGGDNPLGEENVKSRPLNDDEVVDLNPDIIVMSWCGVQPEKYRAEVIYRNPAFADVSAVQNQRVFTVPEAS
ncbi:MAG: helical backbone metal receptor, partial [Pseudomonadota bacterium]